MPLYHHAGALGDFLLSMPLLRALRRRFGTSGWTLAVPDEHARLVQRIFPHCGRIAPGSTALGPLTARSLDPARAGALVARFGGLCGFLPHALEIEALARRLHPDLPALLAEPLPLAVDRGECIEAVLAETIGRLDGSRVTPGSSDFAINPGELPPVEDTADELALRGLPDHRPFVLLHVGASDPRKMPPLSLLEELRARCGAAGLTVVWVRGPVERERGIPLPGGLSLDSPGLVGLAHAIARARLFVGGDTGPTHLASALGCRTIALDLTPNPAWRPRGLRARVLAALDDLQPEDLV